MRANRRPVACEAAMSADGAKRMTSKNAVLA
jgi:hypothetical protein